MGSIVIRSRNIKGPLECTLSERNVPEFSKHISAGTASSIMSQMKFPANIFNR